MSPLKGLVGAGTDAFFGVGGHQGAMAIYRCLTPAPSCTSQITLVSGALGSVNNPFAVGGSQLFYNGYSEDGGSYYLAACPLDGSAQCRTVTTQDTIPGSNPVAWSTSAFLASAGGYVVAGFTQQTGPSDKSHISICPSSGCTAATTFNSLISPLLDLTADSSGVYWLQGDAAAASIQYCPLSGCTGGARVLATNQSSAHALRVHGDFVYWIAGGTSIDGGSSTVPGTGAIMRVAR